MEQEQGCGLGCGLVLLAVGVVLMVLFLPFIGMPLGLLAALVAIVILFVRRRRKGSDDL